MNARRCDTALAAACALVLLAGACARDDGPLQPAVATVTVEGRIGGATPDLDAQVYISSADGKAFDVSVPVDAAGWYRAEVPVGGYLVSLRGATPFRYYLAPGGKVTTRSIEADTLQLREGGSVRRLDFELGGLRLTAGGIAAFSGWHCSITLHRLRPDSTWAWEGSCSAPITGGELSLVSRPARPGSYRISYRFNGDDGGGHGYTSELWYPASDDAVAAATFRIGPDSLTTVTAGWDPPALLTGRINGAWRELGFSPPGITAYDLEGQTVSTLFEVDDDGAYRLPLFGSAPVRLMVDRSDGIWIGGDDEGSATVFALQPGEERNGIDAVVTGLLIRPGSDAVSLIDQGGYVEFRDMAGVMPNRTFYHYNGRWTGTPCMPPGEYRVYLYGNFGTSEWRPQWYDRVAAPEQATTVVVPAGGGYVVLDPVLERGGEISGTASCGALPIGAVIITDATEPLVLAIASVTAEDPAFRWPGLADGSYRIGLYQGNGFLWEGSAPPDSVFWYPGVLGWAAAQDVVIQDAGVVSGLELGPLPAPER